MTQPARLALSLCAALIAALVLAGPAAAASLTATPGNPQTGATLRLQASGFVPRTTGLASLSGVPAVPLRIDAGGRAAVNIYVPKNTRRGTHVLRIRAGATTVSTPVTVFATKRPSTTLVVLSEGPHVLLDPASGAAGKSFLVKGSGFAPLTSVVLRFAGDVVARKRTNGRGGFSYSGKVPSLDPGGRIVRVLSGRFAMNLRFTVLQGTGASSTPPSPPPPPGPTKTTPVTKTPQPPPPPQPVAPPPPPPPPSGDTTKPSVSITAPANGASFSGATTTVTATASDNVGVAGVQFRLDGNPLNGEDTSAPYSTPWNTSTASAGSHTLTAVARDGAGNSTTSSAVTVTVNDTTPPVVAMTAPANGTSVSGNVAVRANATDNSAVASVQFRRGGVNLGAADTSAPYSTTWNSTSVADASTQTFSAVAFDAAGNQATASTVTVTVNNSDTRTIAAAGDIACDPLDPAFNGGAGMPGACQQMATSNLLLGKGYSNVLTLGDEQYECATGSDFLASFDPSWGRVKPIIGPATGNHEYKCDVSASGYFGYFGGAAHPESQGYYSFDVGSYWHVAVLNTNNASGTGCPQVSCAAGSPQENWLRADLAASTKPCTIAIWHHPLFASKSAGESGASQQFWYDLQADGAELVLNGHVHNYERFNPQLADGTADPSGIAEFIVGSGGVGLEGVGNPLLPNSALSLRQFGILELTLRPNAYDFRFISTTGSTLDSSVASVPCH